MALNLCALSVRTDRVTARLADERLKLGFLGAMVGFLGFAAVVAAVLTVPSEAAVAGMNNETKYSIGKYNSREQYYINMSRYKIFYLEHGGNILGTFL